MRVIMILLLLSLVCIFQGCCSAKKGGIPNSSGSLINTKWPVTLKKAGINAPTGEYSEINTKNLISGMSDVKGQKVIAAIAYTSTPESVKEFFRTIPPKMEKAGYRGSSLKEIENMNWQSGSQTQNSIEYTNNANNDKPYHVAKFNFGSQGTDPNILTIVVTKFQNSK